MQEVKEAVDKAIRAKYIFVFMILSFEVIVCAVILLERKVYTEAKRVLLRIAHARIMAFRHFGVDTIFIKVAQREQIGTRYIKSDAL